MKGPVVSSCQLQFPDEQKGAVHIRLTPQLNEALLHAHAVGKRISMCFGDGKCPNAIRVGDQTFAFTANPDERSELVQLPSVLSPSAAAIEVGPITQRLKFKRELGDEDRERVRMRSQAAAEKSHVRKAVVLDGSNRHQPRKAPRVVTMKLPASNVVRRPAAGRPPAGRPRPPQLPASKLAVVHLPAPKALLEDVESPACQPLPVLGILKPAVLQRLPLNGERRAPPPAGPTDKAVLPAKALEAARQGQLQLCVIALLAERTYSRKGLEQAVAEVMVQAGGKAPRAGALKELDRVCKQVAEYRAPGKYVLRPERLKDLEGLAVPAPGLVAAVKGVQPPPKKKGKGKAAAASNGSKQGSDAKRTVTESGIDSPGGKASKRQKQSQGGNIAPSAIPALEPAWGATPDAAPAMLDSQSAPSVPLPSRSPVDKPCWLPQAPPFTGPPLYSWEKEGAQPGQPASGSGRIGSSNRSSTGVARWPSPCGAASIPAMQNLASSLAASGDPHLDPAPDTICTAAAASPNRKPPATYFSSQTKLKVSGGVSKKGEGGCTVGRGSGESSGSMRRSLIGSRFQEDCDESWFSEHITRPPCVQYPIHCEVEYKGAKELHCKKREVYMRLLCELQAHKADIGGFMGAVKAATTKAEAAKWEGQAVQLECKRAPRVARWQTAFQVLHAELKALQKATKGYKDVCLQQQQQQQVMAPGLSA